MSKKKPEWVKKKWKEMTDKIGELPTTVLASEESLPEVIKINSGEMVAMVTVKTGLVKS